MNSIQRQFVLGSVLGVAGVMLLAGALLHWAVDRSLRGQFDTALAAELASLASLVELDSEGLNFDLEDFESQLEEDDEETAFLRVVTASGRTLFQSERLRSSDLDFFVAAEEPQLGWRAVEGRELRAVGMRIQPDIDEEDIEESGADLAEIQAQLEPVDLVLGRIDTFRQPFLARFRLLSIVVLTVAACMMAIFVAAIGRRALFDLHTLADEIAALPVDGSGGTVSETNVPVEIQPIVSRLNNLLRSIASAVEREREMSRDLAHELRTPLAGLRATIEVANHRRRDAGEYRETLQQCHGIVAQMEAIVERLLHLHRVESAQLQCIWTRCDLDALVEREWLLYRARAQERDISVRLDLKGNVEVVSDESLLTLLIGCLLDNAVSHADSGGSIEIETQLKNGTTSVCISNSGSQVDADALPRLLERFTRGDAGRSAKGQHLGIGLTLVQRSVERLRATLALDSAKGDRFRARVTMRSDGPAGVVISERDGVPRTRAASP